MEHLNAQNSQPLEMIKGPSGWRASADSECSESKSTLDLTADFLPFRNTKRRYATMNFIFDEQHSPENQLSTVIENMTSEDQEKILIQEVLYILSGVEASLITLYQVPPNKIGFMVDSRVEGSIRDIVMQIAQLGVYYYTVTRYVENWCRFENGQVHQALAAAVRDIVKDYFILLSQTETLYSKNELTLQKLWFFLHPSLQSFAIISSIVSSIEDRDLRGGQVLTLLHEKAMSMAGDSCGQHICNLLAEKASKPYFRSLENWIYKGMIKDPFAEFFVYDTDRGEGMMELNDDYWEKRYLAMPERCPSFLKKSQNEIVKAGKYLNVIRQCGKNFCIYSGAKITYSVHERVYASIIEKAYNFASKTLLDLLLNDYDLMRRVQSVKHYLLMDQGDFIVQFLDLTENELCKQIDDINPVRLESLLELALRTSSSSTDPYKDCVRVQLFPYGIGEQLLNIIAIETPLEHEKFNQADDFNFSIPGVKGFSFSYDVQWPISLILNSRTIACYQMIFRHLFFCKHVERQLCKVWITGKSSKSIKLETQLETAAAFHLGQKMLNFVQNLQYYMAFEVVEPAWLKFLYTMAKVSNIDEVLECHLELVNSILTDSMLTSSTLLAKITSLLSVCLHFCEKLVGTPANSMPQPGSKDVKVEYLDRKFTSELVEFLHEVSNVVQNLNQSSSMANIIHRVNFNGYYTDALENAEMPRLPLSMSNVTIRTQRS